MTRVGNGIAMWKHLAAVLLVTGLASGSASCQASGSAGPVPHAVPAVPIPPPDGVPDSIYHPSRWVRGTWISGTYVRDVVLVLFRPGTPQHERRAALERVNGRVVGGRRLSGEDGLYVIQVGSPGEDDAVRVAITALRKLPQVISATPEFVDGGLVPGS